MRLRLAVMPSPYVVGLPTKSKQMKPRVLILAHGAGGNRDTPVLKKISDSLSSKSTMVVRFNFPYRMSDKKSPDSQNLLTKAWCDAIEFSILRCAKELESRGIAYKKIKVAIGGRSLGARIASLVCERYPNSSFKIDRKKHPSVTAEIDKCVMLSYPLHAPGKNLMKDAHFSKILQRCIFISGDRDTFASPKQLLRAVQKIPGNTIVEILDGGDHELKTRKADEFTQEELESQLTKLVTLFV